VKPSRLVVVQGEPPWEVGQCVEMLPVLTAQQLRIFHAVQALYETHPGRGCSVREVLLAAGMRDIGLTHDTIRDLAEMGFLTHVPGKPNTIVPRFR